MGFTPRRKVYVLDFADTELDGLIVKTVALPIDRFLEIQGLVDAATSGMEVYPIMVPAFIEVVREWNLEDDGGQPVPVTAEALMGMELSHLSLIIRAWENVMVGVSAPLGEPSSDGEPSPEESLPMEPLSESQPTSDTPG